MPKRIPNLSETILDQAAALFSRLGYANVDMKMVAAEAGTSVGNLYNYHESKPALFLAIMKRWREDIVEALTELMASDLPREQKSAAILKRLYDDVAGWQGLWSEFARGGREMKDELREAKAKAKGHHPFGMGPEELAFLAEFEVLLTGSPSADGVSRWAFLSIMATLQLASRYPENREENWKFIEALVAKI